jgi:hypothetical protein
MEVSRTNSDNNSPPTWSRGFKLLVSALVAFHLAAVFIAPMSFAVRPGSPAIDPLRAALAPYIQALYLDHGYAFFAPDPDPSHLVEYRLEFADGTPSRTGRFPDRHEHFPRMLYHRHFMLSESLNTYYAPPEAPRFPASMPAEERAQELQVWRTARARFEALRDSYARHLAAEQGAASAEVHRLRHDFLPPSQFTNQRDPARPYKLDDPRTYQDLDAAPALLPSPLPAPTPKFLPGISPLPGDTR